MSHFSPKQVALALGVSESSVKRWCDLGTVPVIKTVGGHRRIPRQSLEKLLSQGRDYAIARDSESATGDLSHSSLTRESVSFESLENCRGEFHDALRNGLSCRCRKLIQGLIDSGYSASAAADALITDALHRFGHLWEQGDLAVYQERRACGICHGLLHELKQSVTLNANGPVAIGGAPRGDIYQLPSQLVELALAECGWNATSLGCNLPMHTFIDAVREYHPRLLWISLSAIEAEDSFVNEFNELADSLGKETALIIGGRAANDSLRPKLRYTAHCDSLAHLSELASALVS